MQCDYASHKAVVLRWAELFSTGDLTTAAEVFARDLHDHRFSPIGDIEGIEGETRFIASIRTAFPDLRVEIEDMVAEGDRVAARAIHRGTHGGSFLGVPPTGRSVIYEGTVIFRIVDGRIADRWGTVDLFGILQQLGVTTAVPIPVYPEVGSPDATSASGLESPSHASTA